MALKTLSIRRETIKTPGGEFTVRGLNSVDITNLVRSHGADMSKAFSAFDLNSFGDAAGIATAAKLAKDILTSTPILLGSIIAHAADEPDEIANAMALPLAFQVEALEKIVTLTFETEGGPKKVLETVMRMIQGAAALTDNPSA